ncbi:MAG: signal peptidase II [Candidatus Omnitrophica bacterium]|nr:signal peptidase II [Candidatus Omnitrophota bacterium]
MILILVVIILSLDQLTKIIAAKNLILNQSVPVIKDIFHFTLIHNRGAAFGILKNQLPLFIFTSLLAIILIYRSLRDAPHRLYRVSLGLILAGALGNLIDRLFFGYVVDFLDFRVWPVFNIADSAISIGAILLGYSILRKPKLQTTNYKSQTNHNTK